MQPGSLVQLKSGGPIMTVGWINGSNAHCNWFDERNELRTATFSLNQLRVVNDPA